MGPICSLTNLSEDDHIFWQTRLASAYHEGFTIGVILENQTIEFSKQNGYGETVEKYFLMPNVRYFIKMGSGPKIGFALEFDRLFDEMLDNQ